MRSEPLILVVDDDAFSLDVVRMRLTASGYSVATATDGEQALRVVAEQAPDLLLLDVMLPGIDGIEVCRRLREDQDQPFMPIILVTARTQSADVVAGLAAGADEYLTKPVDHDALVARVRSMLRIKELHDTVRDLNRTLVARVQQQVEELERLARLRRFLAPQVAELIVAGGGEQLASHRREVVVVCCKLAGFSSFAESAEPEEVMTILREHHAALGDLAFRFEGTLERFTVDGLIVVFNDPLPVPEPAEQAMRMAIAMRSRVAGLATEWRKRGHDLAFGVGIAMGYATLGTIGFESRLEYAVVGNVADVAASLCEMAGSAEILANQRVYAAVERLVDAEEVGPLAVRGSSREVGAYRVVGFGDARLHEGPSPVALSVREREVAGLLTRGLTNREMAEALVISERTVAAHVEHILAKLGFSTRTQIGVWAAAQRLTAATPD